jgi:peptidoglycan/xylan/chitin deacetylase (PgdA/CDA1 family)
MADGEADRMRLRARRADSAILVFHGLVQTWVDDEIQLNHLDLRAFEQLVEHLAATFQVVSLGEIADGLAAGAEMPSNSVALTFDDGYWNNATLVAPALERLALPWSVFISTRFIDEGGRLPTYVMRAALTRTDEQVIELPDGERLSLDGAEARSAAIAHVRTLLKVVPQAELDVLTECLRDLLTESAWRELDERFESERIMEWNDVRRLADSGVEIGAHCHDHAILHAAQPPDEIRRQLTVPKQMIEREIGRPCRHFAYPNGTAKDIARAAVHLVGEAGYETGLTNIPGTVSRTDDPRFLPRLYVSRHDPRPLAMLGRMRSHNRRFRAARREVLYG